MKENNVPYCSGLVNKGIALSQLDLPSDIWCLEIFDHVLKDAKQRIKDFENSSPAEQLKLILENKLDDIKELVTKVNLSGALKHWRWRTLNKLRKFPNLKILNIRKNLCWSNLSSVFASMILSTLPQLKHLEIDVNLEAHFSDPNIIGFRTLICDVDEFAKVIGKSNLETLTTNLAYDPNTSIDKIQQRCPVAWKSGGYKFILDEDRRTFRKNPNLSCLRHSKRAYVRTIATLATIGSSVIASYLKFGPMRTCAGIVGIITVNNAYYRIKRLLQ